MIIILRKSSNYDSWFPNENYQNKASLEKQLKKFIDNEGYKILGMSEKKIILWKSDNPSRR